MARPEPSSTASDDSTRPPTPWRSTSDAVRSRTGDLVGRARRRLSRRDDREQSLDRARLLEHLAPLPYDPDRHDDDFGADVSLDRILLLLVGVDHESEYRLCLEAVSHLRGPR
ncbi:hypothetical protein [Cryptosporangium japonicum]|uniref:Uncharacterized protein n=1 Tax=Cryptosporangium japonicum TaxID=80872 RepID=A0ABP3ET57_9ACTN